MKKFITIVLLICTLIGTLTLSLVSCKNNGNNTTSNENSTPPPPKTNVEKANDLIYSIEDAESCYTAAKAFFALTNEEQKQVSSSSALKNNLIIYSSDTRIRDYLMRYSAIDVSQTFHNRLKNNLLNINSYTVNDQTTYVFYDDTTDKYYLYINIDYSAQNKAGGYTRYDKNIECFCWTGKSWTQLWLKIDEEGEIIRNIIAWKYDRYTSFDIKYIEE